MKAIALRLAAVILLIVGFYYGVVFMGERGLRPHDGCNPSSDCRLP